MFAVWPLTQRVRLPVKLLALVVLLAGIALSVWVNYLLINLAIAAWMPGRSNKKWLDILNHPLINYFRPFIKWIVPLCVLLILTSLVLASVRLVIQW